MKYLFIIMGKKYWLNPLREKNIVKAEQVMQMFGNIEIILNVNQELMTRMVATVLRHSKTPLPSSSDTFVSLTHSSGSGTSYAPTGDSDLLNCSIGNIFSSLSSYLKVYSTFVANQDTFLSTYEYTRKHNSHFVAFLQVSLSFPLLPSSLSPPFLPLPPSVFSPSLPPFLPLPFPLLLFPSPPFLFPLPFSLPPFLPLPFPLLLSSWLSLSSLSIPFCPFLFLPLLSFFLHLTSLSLSSYFYLPSFLCFLLLSWRTISSHFLSYPLRRVKWKIEKNRRRRLFLSFIFLYSLLL